jgi:hypothetical protein
VDDAREKEDPMKKRKRKPDQVGDVIGISHPTGSIPHDHVEKGGHPQGIELEDDHGTPGLRDVPQRSGATGADLGGAGQGNTARRKIGGL